MAQTFAPTDTESAIADLYEMVELRMLKRISEKLKAGGSVPDWQARKLLELELLKRQISGDMTKVTSEAMNGLSVILKEANDQGFASAGNIVSIYSAVSQQIANPTNPIVANRALAALYQEQTVALGSVHHTVLRSTEDAFRDAVAQIGAPGMLVGADTRATAIQATLNRLADKGITGFVDKSGRKWEMRAYVEMATGTAVHRANTEGTLQRLQEAGRDLVVVSDHGGECELCRPWEGKVLSISGVTGGSEVAGTVAAARAAGLEHPGCRHRYSIWIPGVSKPPAPQGKPADYELRTRQRAMERQVRAWKRRDAVGDPKAPAYVKKWQAELNDYVKANGLKRRYDREQLLSGKTGALPTPPKPKPKPVPAPAPKPKPVPAPAPKVAPASKVAPAPKAAPAPAPKAAAHLSGSASVKQLRSDVKVLEEKLSKVNPTSPWGKKYTADLAQKKAILSKIDEMEAKLAKVNPTSPWGKKYIKELDLLEGQLKGGVPLPPKVVPVPKAAAPEVKPVSIPKPVSKPVSWKGTPAPVKPTIPDPVRPSGPGAVLFTSWIDEAKKRFADYAAKTGNLKNDLTKSNNWSFFEKVTHGDKSALNWLLSNKYIDQKMYDEALDLIKKASTPAPGPLAEYTRLLAAAKAAREQWNTDIKAWRAANGIPEPRLGGMDAALRHYDDRTGTKWANDNLKQADGEAKTALKHYTTGAYRAWNGELRNAASEKRALSPSWAEWTRQADSGFKPLPQSLIVNRGTDMGEFVINGSRSASNNPLDLVGTIQRAEGYTSTSVGATSAFGGDVRFRVRIPKDYPTAWVDPYSANHGERELIIARGSNFYIHSVYKTPSGGWVVEAEVLPADVDPSVLSLADVSTSTKPFN